MRNSKVILASLLALTLVFTFFTFITNSEAGTERHGDWFVECDGDSTKAKNVGNCLMQQGLQINKENQKGSLGSMRIGKIKDKDGNSATQVLMVTPLGILIPGGVVLQIDDDKEQVSQLPILRCTQAGCFSEFLLPDEAVQKLKKGNKLHAYYKTPANKNLKTTYSLKGFSKAYDKVSKAGF